MSGEGITLSLSEKWNLYKWDADVVGDNPPDPTQIDAASHPGCVEIWEMLPGEPAKCIYRRQ
jgi:hypothetical protein